MISQCQVVRALCRLTVRYPRGGTREARRACTRRRVEHLDGDGPAERADGGGEDEVEEPGHRDEGAARVVVIRVGREDRDDACTDDERQTRERVRRDERPAPPQLVDEQHAERLADERDHRVAGLKAERRRGVDSDATSTAR